MFFPVFTLNYIVVGAIPPNRGALTGTISSTCMLAGSGSRGVKLKVVCSLAKNNPKDAAEMILAITAQWILGWADPWYEGTLPGCTELQHRPSGMD